MPTCSICKNYSSKTRGKGISYHRFPQDESRLQQWLTAVKCHLQPVCTIDKIRALNNSNNPAHICSEHFSSACFEATPFLMEQFGFYVQQKRVLLPNSVPTIFHNPPGTKPTSGEGGSDRAKVNVPSFTTKLIREILGPVAKKQAGQSRTPKTRPTAKEGDDQEKNPGNGENNTTTSQLSCGTADIKHEPLAELEEDLVNCCNSTAQLLSDECGTVSTDAVEENEHEIDNCYNTSTPSHLSCTVGTVECEPQMNTGNCYNTNASSQSSCTVGTVEGELEVNTGNCYNTSTPSQLGCSTAGFEVKNEGGPEMTLGSCNNTVTSQQSCTTIVTSQPSSSTAVIPQMSSSTVVTPQMSSSTVVTPQPSSSTVVTPQMSSSTVVTPQMSCSTVGTSVKQEDVQEVHLDNGNTTSTTSQQCSDMVGINITWEHDTEENLGSSMSDQQTVESNPSEFEETTPFDLNVNLSLVQSFHAYCVPSGGNKQAAKIPRVRTRKPAKSKCRVRSSKTAECVPVQVDYVGTGHAVSGTSQDSNGSAANPGLTLLPILQFQPSSSQESIQVSEVSNELKLPKAEQGGNQVLELRKEDDSGMDGGNSNITDSSSSQVMWKVVKLTDSEVENGLSNGSNISDAKEEDVLEDEDDFQESDEELSSSEDEKKGHKSDSSWHMSSEEEELFGDSDDSMSSCDSDWLEQTERRTRLARQRQKWKTKTSWLCRKCPEKFTSKRAFHEHKLEAHPVPCEYCEEKFTSTQGLQKHMKTHMPSEDKLDIKGNKLHMCDHCGKFFTSIAMKRHEVQISEARPYKCEVENCKSSFKQKYSLKKHINVVHKRDRFPCPYEGCTKSFGIRATMLKHYRVHTDERSLQCSHCGKMFQRTDHLRVHMRIHTGDTPFNCHLCNYSGRQSNSLRSHMKVHHPEHCKKSGDKNGGAKPGRPRKKVALEKDGLADGDKEGGAKPRRKPRKKAVLEAQGAKPRKKAALEKDGSADKAPGSAKKTAAYSTRSLSHRAKKNKN